MSSKPSIRDIIKFERLFRTEADCHSYLARQRWRAGFRCPQCGSGKAWRTRRELLHCAKCRADVSATAGTLFHGSRIPLKNWFWLVWWLTHRQKGFSSLALQRELQIRSYKTAWRWSQKLRRVLDEESHVLLSGRVAVGTSRVDDVGPSQSAPLSVAIAVEEEAGGIGRIRLKALEFPTPEALVEFVSQTVSRGSAIVNDGTWGAEDLPSMGYTCRPARIGRPVPRPAPPPAVREIGSKLRRWMAGSCVCTPCRHLQLCLDGFAFRDNLRVPWRPEAAFEWVIRYTAGLVPRPDEGG